MKWNPWHGCHKLSEGCRHCYVYRMDLRHEKDASEVKKNVSSFREPVSKIEKANISIHRGQHFILVLPLTFFWKTLMSGEKKHGHL